MLVELDARAQSGVMTPRGMCAAAEDVHSRCFYELTRQVSVHCRERGLLLKGIWEGWTSLFKAQQRAAQNKLDEATAAHAAEAKALRSRLSSVTQQYNKELQMSQSLQRELNTALVSVAVEACLFMGGGRFCL